MGICIAPIMQLSMCVMKVVLIQKKSICMGMCFGNRFSILYGTTEKPALSSH